MKQILFYIILFFAFLACGSANNMSGSQNGWVNLFDGKSTSGWHSFKKQTVGTGWEVQDGALHLNPSVKDGGDLTTNEDFENFHLQLEWKIAPGGNSGVIFLVQDNGRYDHSFLTGPEMQVIDNGTAATPGHPDAANKKHRAGDLYDLIACSQETAKPAGEWNRAEIICNKGNLQLMLNGKKVVETTMWTAEWNRLVANSKFKDWKDFAKFRSGKISLQDHGDEVWYRKIKIKRL